MAMIPAFAFMVMSVVVIMAVGVAVRRVGVFVGQEIRVEVENGIQVEAADVDDGLQVGVAEIDGRDRCTRIDRSEEHTSELQSLMRISYAVFCLKKKTKQTE